MKNIVIDEPISKPNILQWFSLCVWIPMQEEILFRYAGYHLLENYIGNALTVQIVNGILFGLLHASNGLVLNMNSLDYLVVVIANGHLGYCLATMHDNIFLCVVIHGIYNFIGINIVLYFNRNGSNAIKNVYVYTEPRRRASSVGFDNKYETIHTINQDKIDKQLLESIDKYNEKKNCRYKDISNKA